MLASVNEYLSTYKTRLLIFVEKGVSWKNILLRRGYLHGTLLGTEIVTATATPEQPN